MRSYQLLQGEKKKTNDTEGSTSPSCVSDPRMLCTGPYFDHFPSVAHFRPAAPFYLSIATAAWEISRLRPIHCPQTHDRISNNKKTKTLCKSSIAVFPY